MSSVKWDQSKAWEAIETAAPVILGPTWKSVIAENTPIAYDALARWEARSVNPGHNRMLPRLATIGNLMEARVAAFETALSSADRLVSGWRLKLATDLHARKLETDEGFRVLDVFASTMFGPMWQQPLSRYLQERYSYSISQRTFSFWKQGEETQERLIDVLKKMHVEASRRSLQMKIALDTYRQSLATWQLIFPQKRAAVLTKSPSAVLSYLPNPELLVAMAA